MTIAPRCLAYKGGVIMRSIDDCHEIVRGLWMKRDKTKDPSYSDKPGVPQLGS